jgi:thioredoxin-like negative regulator of GroEL
MDGPVQLQRLARSYLDAGRSMEALVVAKKGAERFPSFVTEFHLLLAEAYVADGRVESARALLEAQQVSNPGEARIRDALSRLRR